MRTLSEAQVFVWVDSYILYRFDLFISSCINVSGWHYLKSLGSPGEQGFTHSINICHDRSFGLLHTDLVFSCVESLGFQILSKPPHKRCLYMSIFSFIHHSIHFLSICQTTPDVFLQTYSFSGLPCLEKHPPAPPPEVWNLEIVSDILILSSTSTWPNPTDCALEHVLHVLLPFYSLCPLSVGTFIACHTLWGLYNSSLSVIHCTWMRGIFRSPACSPLHSCPQLWTPSGLHALLNGQVVLRDSSQSMSGFLTIHQWHYLVTS